MRNTLTDIEIQKLVNKTLSEIDIGNFLKKTYVVAKKVMCKDYGINIEGFCNEKGKPVRFGPCSALGVKTDGFCDWKTKKPITSCSKIGVKVPNNDSTIIYLNNEKTDAVCFADNKKIIKK